VAGWGKAYAFGMGRQVSFGPISAVRFSPSFSSSSSISEGDFEDEDENEEEAEIP